MKNEKERFYSNFNNRKLLNKDIVNCKCPTCDLVGNSLIVQQYTNFQNILIKDDSKLIFNPFLEKVIQ